MTHTQLALRAITASALALGSVFAVAVPAFADGNVDISSDGASYGSTLTAPLFDQSLQMIPGGSSSAVFYVRNSGSDAGYLRIALDNVVVSDADFANALKISASTAGHAGTPVSISKANPCWGLLQGQSITPGETVAVTMTAALGDLDGMAGQGATAGMAVRVTLSELSTAGLSPTDCGDSGTDVAVFNPAARTTRAVASTAVATPGVAALTTNTQPVEANTQLPTLAIPGGGSTVDPNTWRLYQELLVLLMIAALILGSGWYVMMAWLRRRRATAGSGT